MRRRLARSEKRCEWTGKIRYKDEQSAALVVHRAVSNGFRKVPVRWYWCEFCNGWHTTSQERKETS